eukprot:m.233764 g.233764  ORF g.233764 m.233764 type:complete len:105 (-) comp16029_c0_seq8:658-972(-)
MFGNINTVNDLSMFFIPEFCMDTVDHGVVNGYRNHAVFIKMLNIYKEKNNKQHQFVITSRDIPNVILSFSTCAVDSSGCSVCCNMSASALMSSAILIWLSRDTL